MLHPKRKHARRRRCPRHRDSAHNDDGRCSSIHRLASILLFISGASNQTSVRFVHAQNPNKNFCGSTWQQVSSNCAKAQHCPNASDDECPDPFHYCFADTMCDASKGDGIPALTGHPMASTNAANPLLTRFCQGSVWNPQMTSSECKLEDFCGDEAPCQTGMICHFSSCHLHDVLKKEQEIKMKEEAEAKKQKITLLPENDSKRFNSCGISWTDANSKCSQWCWGEEANECLAGEDCFGNTSCYNDAGLAPSPAPSTAEPTTRAPTVRSDPMNFRFCGKSWDKARCEVNAHCPDDKCPNDGEVCFTKQQCNIHDLTKPPTLSPSISPSLSHNNPIYYQFCGKTVDHAANICSLATRCADDEDCPDKSWCFRGLPEKCNAFYLQNPHLRTTPAPSNIPTEPIPSRSPTPAPTLSPTTGMPTRRDDPRNTRFCGRSWDTAVCSKATHCPKGTECKNGEICYTKWQCNASDYTAEPTPEPTRSPILPFEHYTNYQFCGATYQEANNSCRIESHCMSDSDCSEVQMCFRGLPSHCNLFMMTHPELRPTSKPTRLLVPSAPPTEPIPSRSPTPAPTLSPTTRAPTVRSDPINIRFCGRAWDLVTCSREAHCPTGLECKNGEICFTSQSCNFMDLTPLPTPAPSNSPNIPLDAPSNFLFCGKTFHHAVENCSLETHCASNGDCSDEEACFDSLPGHCNALLLTKKPIALPATMSPTPLPVTPRPSRGRTQRPTPLPNTVRPTSWSLTNVASETESSLVAPKRTLRPTRQPATATTAIEKKEEEEPSLWCGLSLQDANANCGSHDFYSCSIYDYRCPFGWTCFAVTSDQCGVEALPELSVNKRTRRPSPSPVDTEHPTTRQPTPEVEEPVEPVNESQNNQPDLTSFTSRPTTPKPSRVPTRKPLAPTKRPSKQPASKPASQNNEPDLPSLTFRPTTSKPSRVPTQTPATQNKQPTLTSFTPKPTTLQPSQKPTQSPSKQPVLSAMNTYVKLPTSKTEQSNSNVIQTSTTSPTSYPVKSAVDTNAQPNGGKFTSNKQTNQGKGKTPTSSQLTANGDTITGKNPTSHSTAADNAVTENPNDEQYPPALESVATTSSSSKTRKKFYCVSHLNNFAEDCVNAMECSGGIACPSGHFCLQYECKNRPPSSLDLCPFGYVGFNSRDCKTYYECDAQGYYVGPTYTCEAGYKFDKSSSLCIRDYWIDSQCKKLDSISPIELSSEESDNSSVADKNTGSSVDTEKSPSDTQLTPTSVGSLTSSSSINLPPPAPAALAPSRPTIYFDGNNYSADHGEDSRLIAYVANWQNCPTAEQVDAYSHIVIAFAVTYTFSPGQNTCDTQCNIASTVPICNNQNNQVFLNTWRAAGKKVILSFGGAGMGGSWSGDPNNCWDFCFGREDKLSTALVNIVDRQNFDGIDIDYEYCYDIRGGQHFGCTQVTAKYSDAKAQKFLNTLTSKLRTKLDALQVSDGYNRGRYELTHAPLDSDLTPDSMYFQILRDRRADLDFLMPQFYNGYTRPAVDGIDGTGVGALSAADMFKGLANDLFDSEPHKVVFGHCISDCSGTGSNVNSAQAVQITADLKTHNNGEFACNGGAFFWASAHDTGGAWSDAVVAEVSKTAGCSCDIKPSTATSSDGPKPTTTDQTGSMSSTAEWEPDLTSWFISRGGKSLRSMNTRGLKILALTQLIIFHFVL